MRTITIFDWAIRILGTIALLLGLLIWIFQLNIVSIHMVFGLLVALTLLIISVVALFTSGLRLLGLIGIVYALILPIFGLRQDFLLIGDLHWLIKVLHMLVGIGALAYAGLVSLRYRRLKQAQAQPL